MDYQSNYPGEQDITSQSRESPAVIKFTDVLAQAPDILDYRKGGNVATMSGAEKVQDYGSIVSMELPKGFVLDSRPVDAVYLNLGDDDPRRFKSSQQPDSSLGLWHTALPQSVCEPLRQLLQRPAHQLSDVEYFKISSIMSPGPWAGDGRNHELSMATADINGKRAIVYDSWRTADPARDGFDAEPQPDDLRTRVVFFQNSASGKLDVAWMQAPVGKFDASAQEFDRSLRSIKWK